MAVILLLFGTDFPDEAIFSLTNRGHFKLMHEGFEYIKNHTTNTTTFWRCVQNRWKYCKGKARSKQIGQLQMVAAYDAHNHPPMENATPSAQLKQR